MGELVSKIAGWEGRYLNFIRDRKTVIDYQPNPTFWHLARVFAGIRPAKARDHSLDPSLFLFYYSIIHSYFLILHTSHMQYICSILPWHIEPHWGIYYIRQESRRRRTYILAIAQPTSCTCTLCIFVDNIGWRYWCAAYLNNLTEDSHVGAMHVCMCMSKRH